MSNLGEVRIGADAPPDARASNQRLRTSSTATTANSSSSSSDQQEAALEQLLHLKKLKTLVLKDYGKIEVGESDPAHELQKN